MRPTSRSKVSLLVHCVFARLSLTFFLAGLLPLTFADVADYNKIGEGDKVSIVNLATTLKPGSVCYMLMPPLYSLTLLQQLTAVLTKPDGKKSEIKLNHTFNAGQIEWFKSGSALNRMKEVFEAEKKH